MAYRVTLIFSPRPCSSPIQRTPGRGTDPSALKHKVHRGPDPKRDSSAFRSWARAGRECSECCLPLPGGPGSGRMLTRLQTGTCHVGIRWNSRGRTTPG